MSNLTATNDSIGSRLAATLETYMQAAERGELIDRAAFLAEHDDLADELRRCLESLDFIQHASLTSGHLSLSTELPGDQHVLGDFRLLNEIGRGGMGVVYVAEQISLERRVAVKVLPFAALLDPLQLARFKNESRAAAMLKHPRIVSVFSVGCERGVHFYAMELVEGRSLAEVLGQSQPDQSEHAASQRSNEIDTSADTDAAAALSTQRHTDRREFYRRTAQLGIQAAEALHYAHEAGVIHRDIKPSNLLLDREGQLSVTDFGLARIRAADDLTMTGDVIGTLRYMSPEQLDSSTLVDERVDIYGLGITLLELACGQPVFPGNARREIEQRIISGDRVSPRSLDPQLPSDLETILLKAAATDRADRYLSAGDLADDLQRWLANQPIHARRVGKWERMQRWVSRNQRVAVLGATIASLLALIAVFTSLLAVRFAADARREQVTTHAQTIRLAQLELERGNYEVVQRELLTLVPITGMEDLRGFPWYWLWDECQAGAAKHTIRHVLSVGGLTWSADDSLLVSSSWSRLYGTELAGNTPVWEAASMGGVISSLTRLGSTGELVSGRDDGRVTFWNDRSGAKLREISLDLPADQRVVRTISASADGRFLAIGASGEARYGSTTAGHVWIWDTSHNEFVHKLCDGLEGRVFAGFTDDRLLVTSYAGELTAFEFGTWQQREQVDCRGMVTSLAISADRRLVATASATGRGMEMRSHIDVWDANRLQRRSTLAPHAKPIHALAFQSDGPLLAAGSDSGRLALINVDTADIVANRRIHNGAISAIAFSADRSQLATGSSDNTACIWDIASLADPSKHSPVLATPHIDSIYSSGLLDNGRTMASVDNSGRLLVWDVATEKIYGDFLFECDDMRFAMLRVAPDQTSLAVSRHQWPFQGSPSLLAIVDVADLTNIKIRHQITLPRGVVYGRPAFSHDCQLVAIGSNEHIVVYSAITGRLHEEIDCEAWVKCVEFSTDGQWLVASGDGKWARIYRVSDWHLMHKIALEAMSNMSLSIALDSRSFATGGSDGQVRMWTLPAGEPTGPEFKDTRNWILNVQYSPDGRLLLTSGKDGTLRIWLRESGEELVAIPITCDWLSDGSFSADGQTIVAAANTDVYLFKGNVDGLERLSVKELEAIACQPGTPMALESDGERQ